VFIVAAFEKIGEVQFELRVKEGYIGPKWTKTKLSWYLIQTCCVLLQKKHADGRTDTTWPSCFLRALMNIRTSQ